jgi:hypothetical protein
MGLGWGFGVANIQSNSLVLQYLFAIFTAFQGLCIMHFHVYRDPAVRRAYHNSASQHESSSKDSTSRHGPAATRLSKDLQPSVRERSVASSSLNIAAALLWALALVGLVCINLAYYSLKSPISSFLRTSSEHAYDWHNTYGFATYLAASIACLLVATLSIACLLQRARRCSAGLLASLIPLLNLAVVASFAIYWIITRWTVLPALRSRLACDTSSSTLNDFCVNSIVTEDDRRLCQVAIPDRYRDILMYYAVDVCFDIILRYLGLITMHLVVVAATPAIRLRQVSIVACFFFFVLDRSNLTMHSCSWMLHTRSLRGVLLTQCSE